jgi:hypothetical protein
MKRDAMLKASKNIDGDINKSKRGSWHLRDETYLWMFIG